MVRGWIFLPLLTTGLRRVATIAAMKTYTPHLISSGRRSPFLSRVWLAVAAALVSVTLVARGGVTEFPSAGGITITDHTTATPYPSNITVSGITGTVTAVRVKLNGFSHSWPEDADVSSSHRQARCARSSRMSVALTTMALAF